MDTNGKLHRMPKSVPVYDTVAQVGVTTRHRNLFKNDVQLKNAKSSENGS